MEINEFLNSGGTIDDGNEVGPVERNDADQAMTDWIGQAAAVLESSGLPPLEIREQHLSDAIKSAISSDIAGQAVSKVLRLDAWPLSRTAEPMSSSS